MLEIIGRMEMNKTKLASLNKVVDIKKYLDLIETYDKFENMYSMSSKIFSLGWNETEIYFNKKTVNAEAKYFFYLKYHSSNGIPKIYEIKILLNDGVLSFNPIETSYHNDGKTYWTMVSVELTIEQILKVIESPLCEIRVDEKYGNKDYPNKVAKEFREKLKDFYEGVTYIADFPASKEVLLSQIAAENEAEANAKLQADEERKLKAQEAKLKAQEEKKSRGVGSKILSLIKWFFLILLGIAIVNAIVGKSPSSKDSNQPKAVEQPVAEPKQEALKEQEQPVSKEGSPQAEGK